MVESHLAQLGCNVSASEKQAWANSLPALAQILSSSEYRRIGVILEYWLPLSSQRVDALLCGFSPEGIPTAIAIELKQWSKVSRSAGEREVRTFVGGGERTVLHPSAQVNGYLDYLTSTHSAFHSGETAIRGLGCAYLHNITATAAEHLFDPKFAAELQISTLFCSGQEEQFADYLRKNLSDESTQVHNDIAEGHYHPSRQLMDSVRDALKKPPSELLGNLVLLDEQQLVFDAAFAAAHKAKPDQCSQAILVTGGPGSGKSVVALKLLGALMGEGIAGNYATGSSAFTQTLKKVTGTAVRKCLKYTNNYQEISAHSLDVLIVDEAHRIRKETVGTQYRPAKKTGLSQLGEMAKACKVLVLFMDDHQGVKPDEIGTAQYVREELTTLDIPVMEIQLSTQFRCGGSDGFVTWVSDVLGITDGQTAWRNTPDFEFSIYSSPQELDAAIREKASDTTRARLVAGFCWPWSNKSVQGALVNDIEIENFSRPWNAHPKVAELNEKFPPAPLWAYDPRGLDQVGCIYTAQGFEFDYVGVIFGTDLRFVPETGSWAAFPQDSRDPSIRKSINFLELVKHTYRVLLTRGIKGCYVCFLDKPTEEYVKSRLLQ